MFRTVNNILRSLNEQFRYIPSSASLTLNLEEQKCFSGIARILEDFKKLSYNVEFCDEIFFDSEESDSDNCEAVLRTSAEFLMKKSNSKRSDREDEEFLADEVKKSIEHVNEKYTASQLETVKRLLEQGSSEGTIAKKLKKSIDEIKVVKRYIQRGGTSEQEKYKLMRKYTLERFVATRAESRSVTAFEI